MGFQGLKAVIKAVLVSFQVRSVSLGWWRSCFCLLMAWDTVSIPSRQAAPKEDYITDISRLQGGSLMVRMVILVGRSIIKALKDAAHSRPSESSSFLCALCYHVCCLLVWLQCFERMRFFSHCTPIGFILRALSLSLWLYEYLLNTSLFSHLLSVPIHGGIASWPLMESFTYFLVIGAYLLSSWWSAEMWTMNGISLPHGFFPAIALLW